MSVTLFPFSIFGCSATVTELFCSSYSHVECLLGECHCAEFLSADCYYSHWHCAKYTYTEWCFPMVLRWILLCWVVLCYYNECHNGECLYAAVMLSFTMLSDILLIVINNYAECCFCVSYCVKILWVILPSVILLNFTFWV